MNYRIDRFDPLIARVRRLHLAATPGPWSARVASLKNTKKWLISGPHIAVAYPERPNLADCELVSEFRNAMPELADALDEILDAHARLTSEAVQLRAENNAMLARLEAAAAVVIRAERKGMELAALIVDECGRDGAYDAKGAARKIRDAAERLPQPTEPEPAT